MRGHEDLASARLAGMPIARVDIVIDGFLPGGRPGLENVGGVVTSLLHVEAIDTAPRCDVRAVRGLPVLILAETSERALPFLDECIEHGATRVHVCCAHEAIAYTESEGIRAWEL